MLGVSDVSIRMSLIRGRPLNQRPSSDEVLQIADSFELKVILDGLNIRVNGMNIEKLSAEHADGEGG